MKIKVSQATFNEIQSAMKIEGADIGTNQSVLTLEKGDVLLPPIDFRLATVRKDAIDFAVKCFTPDSEPSALLELAEQIYQFIVSGKSDPVKEWK